MIRVLIVEDERTAASRLESMLNKSGENILVLERLDSVEGSVRWLKQNNPPDLLFLDIQLGDGLSFEIFKQVQLDCFVIFTTAYDEYALRAFELNSIDYLLKPIDPAKLSAALQKYQKLNKRNALPDYSKLIDLLEQRKSQFKKRFLVNIADKIRLVETRQIAYFYSLEKSSFLCTVENQHLSIDFSLDHLETILDPGEYFRVNRQYIIRFEAIHKMFVLSKSRIKLELFPPTKEGLLVSSTKSAEFRKWLDR